MSKADKRERQRINREAARLERERLIKRDRRMRAARNLALLIVPVVALLVILSMRDSGSSNNKSTASIDRTLSAPKMTIDRNKTYTAVMKTSEGTITFDLDVKNAPKATNNFVYLARKRFYDGLTIHRVVPDGGFQGGDPNGDSSGDPGYEITGEVPTDHYPIGSIAAARGDTSPKGGFGSQFFVVTGPSFEQLPNDYARFGKIADLAGLDVAKKIAALSPSGQPAYDGPPTKLVKIDSVKITEK